MASVENAAVISYNGKDIKSLEAGKTGTVRCKGKKMKTDLVVKALGAAAPKLQEKTITVNGVYPPDSGYDGFSKVTVDVAGKVLPKYDGEVIIEGEPESGGGGGGSAEFNIAYGDTAPSDTSKLWVKANEPEAVSITSSVVTAGEELTVGYSALPTAAHYIASAAVGTKVYLFGGRGSNEHSTINVFDTETKTVETLSTALPKASYNMAPAVVGTKVYLFGGYGGGFLNTINVFDTVTRTIETLSTTLPKAAYHIASAVVGTKVYLFGGQNSSSSSYLSTINVLDTKTNTIATIGATLPQSAHSIASAVIGAKVYLFGGKGSNALSTINVFDTETGGIETLSTALPSAMYDMTSAVVGTKVYLFGGQVSKSTIIAFDTASNTIETLSTALPKATYGITANAVGTKIYLFGGMTNTYINTIDMFTVSMPLATNNLLIEASATKNRFNLLPGVELGVNNVYLGNADGNGERVDAYLHNGTEWVEV